MANQAQQAKVLRIGIIIDGKIVQERLIKANETVTVGDSPKNTFVLPNLGLSKADFPLFESKGGKYTLQFTEKMKGKVGASGSVTALDKVRSDASVQKDAALGAWKLPLSEDDRGKIAIGNVTVLFQFVTAPPTAAVRPQRVDFRPRLIQEDDALLFGFLALFSAIGAIFVIWAWNTESPPEMTIDELDEKWTKLIVQEPPEAPPVEIQQEGDTPVEETPQETKAETKSENEAKSKPQMSAEERQAKAREDVLKKSVMLQFLTTRGEGEGQAKDLWSEGDGSLEAAALSGATSVAAADENTKGLRGGGSGPGGDADIGELGQIGGGSAQVAEAPVVQVQVDVGEGEADDMEQGDQASVKKVVSRNSGQLKYCYESRLKANPDLSGRVEIEWVMTGGRVTAASVFANTTGDNELASCNVGKIKRCTFPSEIEGEVLWPFIFKQKQ